MSFNLLLQQILMIPKQEQERIFWELKTKLFPATTSDKLITELREKKFSEGFVCIHCGSKEVSRYGTYKGRQRYKCKCCHKSFSDLTNTPLKGTHYPDKWIIFIECMLKGMPLREASRVVGVTHVTLFYWRHKLLKALGQMKIDSFNGIVEMDETYFLYSEKGNKHIEGRKPRKRGGVSKYRGISKEQVCVLVARDRKKNTVSKVSCMGRIIKTQVEATIGQYLSEDNILCTDAWRAYKTYANDKGVEHYRIKADGKSHVIKGIYHIQNVNNYHSRLNKWLGRFNGIASKYLDNYLAWFRFLDMKNNEVTISNLKDMLILSCLFKVHETYDSLRVSQFSITA